MSPPLLLPHYFSFIINIFLFLSLFLLIPIHVTSDSDGESYKSCAPFTCGKFTNISYPFWSVNNQPSYCGHPNFNLDCQHGNLTIEIKSQKFHIIDINQTSQLLRIARLDLWSYHNTTVGTCPKINESLDLDFFKFTSNDENYILLYECDVPDQTYSYIYTSIPEDYQFISCLIEGKPHDAYIVLSTEVTNFNVVQDCKKKIKVHGLRNSLTKESNVLEEGFEVEWSGVEQDICNYCKKSGGRCGYNTSKNAVMCLCPDKKSYRNCGFCRPNSTYEIWLDDPGCKLGSPTQEARNASGKKLSRQGKMKIILGSAGAAFVALFICIIVFCFKYKSTKNNQNIEAFLKSHEAFTVSRYKFSHIKKMTNNFKVKLGQGGFGAVYKGKLSNGRDVAVKILKTSKGNGEDFMNEVSSITKTSHVNVVALLGFCSEGWRKALIYELMSNGSLDKFIYNKGPETISSLSWEILYQIAKGIARGLEYLHRGCSTRILHFDIKPHNILLDENFCPKISDFGLARLCPKKESAISMSNARGTVGYVAPELWNRNFGRVSHKSDVYSYGMMLLEMVGGRKNLHADASHTSEIYFPHWVCNRLELGGALRSGEVIAAEEDEIAKKMTIVGLWCIQTFPNDRPTMSKVIEMLEGNMNSLEIPPKPILSSPIISIQESSASSNLSCQSRSESSDMAETIQNTLRREHSR